MTEEKVYLNRRIECDGFIGTVKYVGTVGNTKGQWLGIDWDDPTRGKHNGTNDGVHYFDTWHPTSGSFVRPQKVNFGISCPEAIRIRYGLIDDESVGVDRAAVAGIKKFMNAPFVEMVGFSKVNKKQSNFSLLQIVCLQDENVSSAGRQGELAILCPNVEELDLSRNLLNSWECVVDICSQLPYLKHLNVSDNSLPVTKDITSWSKAFLNLRHLNIAKMKYDWITVTLCLKAFPSIEQVALTSNVIQKLNDPEAHLHKLKEISLEQNFINDWKEVLKLGKLPHLTNLNLNSNEICEIRFPDDAELFLSLKQLHLSDNKINDWRSVSELEKLKSLEDLKFRKNPVLSGESEMTLRQYVIARISRLKYLNGAEISSTERRGSEYDYIKQFSTQWVELDESSKENFIKEHPRFPSLTQRYGIMEVKKTATADLQSNVINVEFICTISDSEVSKGVKRRIMKNMEVQKLMGIVQRLFTLNKHTPSLFLVRSSFPDSEIALDKPLQEVSFYLMEDGDQIFVR